MMSTKRMLMATAVAIAATLELYTVRADTWTDDKGIVWNYTIEDGTASIEGDIWGDTSAVPKSTTGDISVPSELGGCPVTEILISAFEGCSGLTSITIPASISRVYPYAFEGCSQLLAIKVDDNSQYYRSVDGVLYDKSLKTLICCPPGKKGHLDVLDGAERIEAYACEGCAGLTSVTIPDSVEYIGGGAFEGCSSLSSVVIPDYVDTINFSLFSECTALKTVVLPDELTEIGDWAFYGCTKLSSIVIPPEVEEIGLRAFENCCELTNIDIPANVCEIGTWAFDGCSKLSSIDVDEDNWDYKSVNGVLYDKKAVTLIRCPEGKAGDFVIPNMVEILESGAFDGCANLTSVTISRSVKNIESNFLGLGGVFVDCIKLNAINVDVENAQYKSIDGVLYDKSGTKLIRCPEGMSGEFSVPENVRYIEDGAFECCDSLTNIMLPNSVTSIGYSAFQGCNGITVFTVPESVTELDLEAFADCNNLKSLVFKGNALPEWTEWTLFILSYYLPDPCVIYVPQGSTGWGVEIPSTLMEGIRIEYGEPMSEPDDKLPVFTVEDGVLTKVELNGAKVASIPATVKKIGDNVFSNSDGLVSVIIPSSVTEIGVGAFRNCNDLENVEFKPPSKLTLIGREAFQYCGSLHFIELPASTTNIDGNVFAYCPALQWIGVSGDGSVYKGENGALYSNNKTELFAVPGAATNLTVASTVVQIGDDALSGCTVLRSIKIPEAMKWSVSADLFRDCPEGIQIEYYADPRQDLEFYQPVGWPAAFYLTDKMDSTNSIARFPSGNPIYCAYAFRNTNVGAGMPICFSNALLLVENGRSVYEEFRSAQKQGADKMEVFRLPENLQNLAPGEYTATVLLNEPYMVYEASYGNNSNSVKFVVVPSTTVTFISEDNVVATQGFEKGKAYGSLPIAPSRYGYEFVGWFTAKDGGDMVTSMRQFINSCSASVEA